MNKQQGKLLVLGGFALKLCLAAYSYFITILLLSENSLLIKLSNLLTGNLIGIMYNLAGLAAVLAIVAGFGLIFLADRNIIDLILAILFAFDLRAPFVTLISGKTHQLEAISVNTSFDFLDSFLYRGTASIIIFFAIFFVWSLKFSLNRNRLGAFLIYAAMMISYCAPLFAQLAMLLFYEIGFSIALAKLLFLGVLSLPTISAALFTFVMFLELQRD